MTFFLRCLPAVLIASAAFLGVYLIVSGRKRSGGGESGRTEDADGTPVSAGTARTFFEPAAEDLEAAEACAESDRSGAFDEGPTEIEKAVGESGDGVRLTLVGLLRAGMKVTDPSGNPVTEESLLSGTWRDGEPVVGDSAGQEKGRSAYGE